MKKCSKCKEVFEDSSFSKGDNYCKPCRAEYQRDYRGRKKAKEREAIESNKTNKDYVVLGTFLLFCIVCLILWVK